MNPFGPERKARRRVRLYVTARRGVRGLGSNYGVDINSIERITFEDPYVAEYRNPAIVKSARPPARSTVQILLDGEIETAIVGDKLHRPRLRVASPPKRKGRSIADAAPQNWIARFA
jgi:4,5-dihydroxyphthalate decarboxylase